MGQFKFLNACCLAVFIIYTSACQAEQTSGEGYVPVPASILGTWQVSQVLIDMGKKQVIQGLDDKYLIPKYLGRIVKISAGEISINSPIDTLCEKPEILPRKMTAAQLVANTMTTRIFESTYPTPQDMRLPLANDAPVEVLYQVCKGKLRAKDRDRKVFADLTNALWYINLGENQIAMSWHDDTILILKRLSNDAKPIASFNCAKAGTVVEKTICGSVGVAAYDKSLSQSYKMVMAYYKSKPNTESAIAELKKSQRYWLKQRDRCGADEACLEKVMNIRIGDLNYDLSDYMYQNR